MARINTFFLAPDRWPENQDETVALDGPELRHMHAVLRTKVGQTVRLIDGCGRWGLFVVDAIDRKKAALKLRESTQAERPVGGVSLALAWSKSKRRKQFLEKAVELGARRIYFWKSTFGEGHVPDVVKPSWIDALIQAAKQCQAVHLPELHTVPDGLKGALAIAGTHERCYLAWEAQEGQTPLSPYHLADGDSLVVIGPEGGLSEEEANAFMESGFTPVSLGGAILRWETAATYCLSLGWFAQQESR